MNFFKSHDINIVLEEDSIDFIMEKVLAHDVTLEAFYSGLTSNFEHGLKLVREKTGKNRFFITRDSLLNPEIYVGNLLKNQPGS